MKNLITLLILITPFLNMTSQNYLLRESTLDWTGSAAFSSYELSGTLKTQEGYITIKNNLITSLKIVVNMKSLDHENSDLKSHLKSKDFFDIKNFKTAVFELTEPAEVINGKAKLIGEMTIKGVSKTETIPVVFDNENLKLTFNTTINRVNYGVRFNSPSVFEKLKENAIADDFTLKGILFFKPK